MGIDLIMAAAMATAASSGCSWAHPGANPYRESPSTALASMPMSSDTRRQLRALMAKRQYTDIVTITRDDIVGKSHYSDLRLMHSGHGQVCHGSVDRSAWSPKHEERGLVYCVGDTCVVVPTVCNNVSMLTRKPDPRQAALDESPIDVNPAAGPAATPKATPDIVAAIPDNGPIDFMPPAAGGVAAAGMAGAAAAGVAAADTAGGTSSFLPSPPTPGGSSIVTAAPAQVITSAVPEMPVWSLMLAGVATLLTLRRTRA